MFSRKVFDNRGPQGMVLSVDELPKVDWNGGGYRIPDLTDFKERLDKYLDDKGLQDDPKWMTRKLRELRAKRIANRSSNADPSL